MRPTLERLRPEVGLGMPGVIMLGLVVTTAVGIAAGVAVRSVQVSGTHVRFETAVHLAEHGIDQTIGRLQRDSSYATTPLVTMPSGMSRGEEMAWAMSQLSAADTPTQSGVGGDFAVIKPTNANVIFAAGWVPTRDAARQRRVIRAEYLFSTYRAEQAFVAGGDLVVSGSAILDGAAAGAHANGGVSVTGSATIEGSVTAAGSYEVTGTGASVGEDSGGGRPRQSIPSVDPLAIWNQLATDHPDDWYDLCPDGTVRRPDGTTPCSGSLLFDPSIDRPPFRGWSYNSSTTTWDKDGSGEYGGIYFVHHASADIGRSPGTDANPWLATVITSGATSGTSCDQVAGDLTISGSPVMSGFITGLTAVAGRDLEVFGTPSQRFTGMLAAHEQLFISGNPSLTGALVAEDACDTPSSPVHTSEVSGSMHITYDGKLDVTLGTLLRTTLWLEL